jgi:D-alanine-D-alanine ligase
MSKSRQTIAVIMGGPSREREVSLGTGAAMLENLNVTKYKLLKVQLTQNRQWIFNNEPATDTGQALRRLKKDNTLVLLALHGSFGEDGTIQALLAQHNIPFTGSRAAASLMAMDKALSGELFLAGGLQVPKHQVINNDYDSDIQQRILDKFGLPVVIKPVRQGSSVGVHVVKAAKDIVPALQDALLYDQQVMAQQFIKGREVSCGVLEEPATGRPKALLPTELIPIGSEFFDYKAKYSQGGSREITPPTKMSAKTIGQIQSIAVKAHQLLGCAGYSRTDMIVSADGIYTIETNTLPGMTKTSILPQQAVKAGMTFSELLENILACTVKDDHPEIKQT